MIVYWIILATYTLSLGFIFLFSLVQLNLTFNYFFKYKKPTPPVPISWANLPEVTVQLPIYNEKYVIERLIDCIANLDYPKHKLQIQILDDSNDQTTALVESKIKHYSSINYRIELVQRPVREGYKAGALKYSLARAKGKYIAIFDADFLPPAHFLLETIPHLEADTKLGVVQTRWGHLNENYSIITRLQAFALDAHFVVEQCGRNGANHFMNFNGTAGVWRKETILDAGNWEADTLTEDLDLSYRAQMKQWKFLYIKDLACPSELPVTMNELKAQQGRWTKGAAETARKHLANIWKSEARFMTKIHGSMHLLNSAIFVAFMLAALASVPLVMIQEELLQFEFVFRLASVFLLSMVALTLFYASSFFSLKKPSPHTILQFLYTFPLLLSLSMGLSLHNAIAVIEGYLGKKTPFVRTPKYNIQTEKSTKLWKSNNYRTHKVGTLTWLEGLLGLYFAFGLGYGIRHQNYNLLLLHSLVTFGFLAIFILSIRHASSK